MLSLMHLVGDLLELAVSVVIVIAWLGGFVLAKGFWSTLFCTIPIYAWYLDVAYLMARYGIGS